MSHLSHQADWLSSAKKIVVKIGSAGLAHPQKPGIHARKVLDLAADIDALYRRGCSVILVSSGAIHMGRQVFQGKEGQGLSWLQALSAIGQPLLMQHYQQAFGVFDRLCAQVLLTHDDIKSQERSLCLADTLMSLCSRGIVPILNENDSVAYEEITVGDNDQLAAMVCELFDADALLILTGPDGLMDRHPSEPNAKMLATLAWDTDLQPYISSQKSGAGRGGMQSKVEALRKMTNIGIPAQLGSYEPEHCILRLLQGAGTHFAAKPGPRPEPKQRRLLAKARAGAILRIDPGACQALKNRSSLLPSGILSVEGRFRRGDVVRLLSGFRDIGYGRVEYPFDELRKICGKQSHEIESILGNCPSKVAIHRNNLVLLEGLDESLSRRAISRQTSQDSEPKTQPLSRVLPAADP